MNLIIRILVLVLTFILAYGFVCPQLISSNDDFLVILGIQIFILSTTFIFYQIYWLILLIIKFKKKKKKMRNFKSLFGLIAILLVMAASSCRQVPAGNVGIKFHLLGGEKGVDQEELTPGRYFIGINDKLYLFPTFTQNYVWTSSEEEGSPNDESFNFQDVQGLEINADIGITYKINPLKVNLIFEKYKRGIDEITDTYLRNMVRDALVKRTSVLDVEYIYGRGRTELIEQVTSDVDSVCRPIGIEIEKIYWIGRIKLPDAVKGAIDSKIKATQIAQQRENELREAEAAAKKKVAEAEGQAESILLRAKAQAEANKLLQNSISNVLVDYEKVKKWDGKLPQVVSDGSTLLNLK